jgi:hypothetical protein
MPDFAPSLNVALAGLIRVNAGQKHVIMISDGDPSMPSPHCSRSSRRQCISISAVSVFPHSPVGHRAHARHRQGHRGPVLRGQHPGRLATLPQIFIKEAQTVRRSLIWEGTPFSPAVVDAVAETMRGVTSVPPISGYVVTADREGSAS